MTPRTKGWLLAGLLVVWVGLVAVRVSTYQEPLRTPLTYRSGQALVKTDVQPAAGLPALAKASVSREGDLTLHPPKNIFAPLGRRIEVAAAHESEGGTGQAVRRSGGKKAKGESPPDLSPMDHAIKQARAQREQQALQARQRMAQYRFIGYLSENGEPRAFLGKGTDLYIVRPGETLEGQIRVAAIGATSLKLRDAASETESALPLTQGAGQAGSARAMVPGLPPPGEPPPAGEVERAEHP